MKTKERLAAALIAAKAPQFMVDNANKGVYDDYESTLPAPIAQLVSDCERNRLPELAQEARNGEFDGTREEAEAWARGEGRGTVDSLFIESEKTHRER